MNVEQIHIDGVVNVAEGIIKKARKDFIKGGKVLYRMYGRIPTQLEYFELHGSNNQDIRHCYDAWTFVLRDPYYMFGDIGSETVIETWKKDTIIDYYKDLYMPGAIEICLNENIKCKTNKLHKLTDDEIKEAIKDNNVREDFIKARDYICSTNRESVFDDWAEVIINRKSSAKRRRKS